MMRAEEIAARIGPNWPHVLEQLGIAPRYLRNQHGPCPACGGKDRYRFDNRKGRGGFYCNGCGPGDGFTLLQRVHGWNFHTARDRVLEVSGLNDGGPASIPKLGRAVPPPHEELISRPIGRVLRLHSEACLLADCPDVVSYLEGRALWPRAARSSLRAHVGVDYFDGGRKAGRFPALLAAVRDLDGDLVTIHATYIDGGRKLEGYEPRKLLSPLHGREGCAVRLYPITGDCLGIGEGLETCLAAGIIHDLPVWSALNATLLSKFTPPDTVKRLVIMADGDVPGLRAAGELMQRLQGRVALEIRTPPAPAKDWNDVRKATE